MYNMQDSDTKNHNSSPDAGLRLGSGRKALLLFVVDGAAGGGPFKKA